MTMPGIRYVPRFPTVGFKREMIARHRAEGEPWPTVLLNAHATAEYRPNMEAPLSLFLVLSGQMEVASTGRRHLLRPGMLAWTAATEPYTLTIEPDRPTETFNIHFSETLSGQVLHPAATRPERLLDNSQAVGSRHPFEPHHHLEPLSDDVLAHIVALRNSLRSGHLDSLGQEAAAAHLLMRLTGYPTADAQLADRLQAARPATRAELAARLARARDYALSHLTSDLRLEDLAAVAALSKFHFLRLFTAQYGEPPHRFVLRQRLRLATALLRTTPREVADVALQAGFPDAAAFCRAFKRQVGATPLQYRAQM